MGSTTAPSVGTMSKLAMDPSVTTISDFDSGSEQYEFLSESLRMVQSHAYTGGIRGTRQRNKERAAIVRESIGGMISLNPTKVELDILLPRIQGAAESANVFNPAETLPTFGVLIDRITKCFTYTGCYVNRARFYAQSGGLLFLDLDILGKTEVVSAAGGFPGTVPAIDTGLGFNLSQAALTLGADASANELASFEVIIDNALDPDHFMNSITRTHIVPTDRIITYNLVVPYTADEVDLYDQAVAGSTGSLVFANGTDTLTFTFANLKAPAESPSAANRQGKFMLALSNQVFKSTSTSDLVITNA